ncbi:MAG: hypothetical protein JW735_06765 [Prolixibacteraceae bacterium]|nr:hypothetical protein [Prolixibacteraceae bacterium]
MKKLFNEMKVYLITLSLIIPFIVLNHNMSYGNNILNVSVDSQGSNLGPQKSENDFVIEVSIVAYNDSISYSFDGFYSDGIKVSGIDVIENKIPGGTVSGNVPEYRITGNITFKMPYDYLNILNDYNLSVGYTYRNVLRNEITEHLVLSNTFIINIDDNPPSIPTIHSNKTVISPDESFLCKWIPCSDIDDNEVSYEVILYNDNNESIYPFTVPYYRLKPEEFFYDLDISYDFESCKTYSVVVASVDDSGNKAFSDPFVFYTTEIDKNIPVVQIKNNSTNQIIVQNNGFCYIPPSDNFEARILNYDSKYNYSFSYPNNVIQPHYGGNNYRAFHSIASGPAYINVSKTGCNYTNETTKSIFIQYDVELSSPVIGGYITPHFTDDAHEYTIQNIDEIDAYYFEWEVYNQANILVYTTGAPQYGLTSLYLYLPHEGNYIIRVRAWDYSVVNSSEWGTLAIPVYNRN